MSSDAGAEGRRPAFRIDQLTGLRAVLAPGRAERPDAFEPPRHDPSPDAAERCPFCEGREGRTPPEVWARRPGGGAPDSPGWTQRSVPNLYPLLGEPVAVGGARPGEAGAPGGDEREAAPPGSRAPGRPGAAGPHAAESGFAAAADPLQASRRAGEPDPVRELAADGAHEVIVSAPEHVTSLAGLSEARFAETVAAWRERIRAHADDAAHCHLIVNEGPAAGASLEHSHAQLYALPFVPAAVARERERFAAYHERTMGGHLLADVAGGEVRIGERLVAVDDDSVLVCPWASRSPFHLRVIPRRPAPRFEEDGEVGTAMLRTALVALARAFDGSPQLNLWVRTAPRDADEFHWHLDVVPRLTVAAGFEMGTGVEVDVYPPERAAADLRTALE